MITLLIAITAQMIYKRFSYVCPKRVLRRNICSFDYGHHDAFKIPFIQCSSILHNVILCTLKLGWLYAKEERCVAV